MSHVKQNHVILTTPNTEGSQERVAETFNWLKERKKEPKWLKPEENEAIFADAMKLANESGAENGLEMINEDPKTGTFAWKLTSRGISAVKNMKMFVIEVKDGLSY